MYPCSSCKYVSYCSKQCQREHWVKVHRDQCAALADKVETPVSMHRPDSCPGCKEETDMGGDISSPDSPAWG